MATETSRVDDLAEALREIQERVRARHPKGDSPVAFPDLTPLLHARDAAEAKVAAIGRVNPRRGGPVNALIQSIKRLIARALDWHVRDQVDFNRGVMDCVQATLDALDENNRTLSRMIGWVKDQQEAMGGHAQTRLDEAIATVEGRIEGQGSKLNGQDLKLAEHDEWFRDHKSRLDAYDGHFDQTDLRFAQHDRWFDDHKNRFAAVEARFRGVEIEMVELKDIRRHWAEWRQGWEEKSNRAEIYMLRTISELQQSFQHRVTLADQSFRKTIGEMETSFQALANAQHQDYRKSLDEAIGKIHQQLYKDFSDVRQEYERLIHAELRTLRQRLAALAPAEVASAAAAVVAPQPPAVPDIDWLRFADRFRGSEERIRAAQSMYTERFAGASNVLDIGCGRGEFLEAARDANVGARGIDLGEESVALCKSKGLDAEVADLFEYLPALADGSLGGVYCAQVVEHIAPDRLPAMIRLIAAKTRPGALIAIETPNPECLAIFASHFYIDPTHTRPVPSSLLAFYLEESGFGHIEVRQLAPAVESWPELAELPEPVRNRFFGGLDYALFAHKL